MTNNKFGRGNKIEDSSNYRTLYHLCEYSSFSYGIESNAIVSRAGYVSTTWDETMNKVAGRDHSLFKFVLDGKKLIDTYGAFHYNDFARESGTNRRVSHDEREIGLSTRRVEPLDEYLIGTVLLFNLFSEGGLQWLLYKNSGRTGDLLTEPVAATNRAINTLYRHVFILRKPVWKYNVGNNFTSEELGLLKEVYRVSKLDLKFTESLEIIAEKFPIVDHWGNLTDSDTYRRKHMAPAMVKLLNSYMGDRRVKNVDIKRVRTILNRCINMLGLGENAETIIMHKIDNSGLLHPNTPPVTWGSVLSAAMTGDIDTVIEMIDFFVERDAHSRKYWDENPSKYANHHGTDFGRGDY